MTYSTWLFVKTLKMCSSASGAKPRHSLELAITPATNVPWPTPVEREESDTGLAKSPAGQLQFLIYILTGNCQFLCPDTQNLFMTTHLFICLSIISLYLSINPSIQPINPTNQPIIPSHPSNPSIHPTNQPTHPPHLSIQTTHPSNPPIHRHIGNFARENPRRNEECIFLMLFL